MGSAFTPVHPRDGSPPTPRNGLNAITPTFTKQRSRQRQPSTLLSMMSTVDEDEDENRTVDTVPTDYEPSISSVKSNASSRASNGSANSTGRPALLDFVGGACNASAWFTSCFPCSVVDIDDADEKIVKGLSRESAMDAMYRSARRNVSTSPEMVHMAAATNSSDSGPLLENNDAAITGRHSGDNNLVHVRLPKEETSNGNGVDAPTQSTQIAIAGGHYLEYEDEDMDGVSLDDEDAFGDDRNVPIAVTPELITDSDNNAKTAGNEQPTISDEGLPSDKKPIYKPPKKKRSKKFGIKRMFGMNKKA